MWLLDCWYGDIDPDLRKFVREQYAWLLILYIPAACTSKLQPCDLALNRTVKHEAAEAFAEQFAQALYSYAGTAEERTAFMKVSLATSTLKPLLALFVRQGVLRVKEQPESIKGAWKTAGWLGAWDPEVQQRAKQRKEVLFPGADWQSTDGNAPQTAGEPRDPQLPSSAEDGLVHCAALEETVAAMPGL